MAQKATSTAGFEKWEETPIAQKENQPKFTRAAVVNTYAGDLEGKGHLEYQMAYITEKHAPFHAYEQFVGTLHGKSGTFVLAHQGEWKDGAAKASWNIVPGSGTGELKGISGKGHYEATGEVQTWQVELEYDFADNGSVE